MNGGIKNLNLLRLGNPDSLSPDVHKFSLDKIYSGSESASRAQMEVFRKKKISLNQRINMIRAQLEENDISQFQRQVYFNELSQLIKDRNNISNSMNALETRKPSALLEMKIKTIQKADVM